MIMDQEPKFSPGPWAWHGPDHNIHVAQAEDANMRVCFLTSNGPTEANAHLIASAPDLYAALKAVLPLLPICFPHHGLPGEEDHRNATLDTARDAAISAITKAEGR